MYGGIGCRLRSEEGRRALRLVDVVDVRLLSEWTSSGVSGTGVEIGGEHVDHDVARFGLGIDDRGRSP